MTVMHHDVRIEHNIRRLKNACLHLLKCYELFTCSNNLECEEVDVCGEELSCFSSGENGIWEPVTDVDWKVSSSDGILLSEEKHR